jgi:hypothetical protein
MEEKQVQVLGGPLDGAYLSMNRPWPTLLYSNNGAPEAELSLQHCRKCKHCYVLMWCSINDILYYMYNGAYA